MNLQKLKKFRYNLPPGDFPTNELGFNRTYGGEISAHLPLLEFLARQCRHVTEFGTRCCNSTTAFAVGLSYSGGTLVCYDIVEQKEVKELAVVIGDDVVFEFNLISTLRPNLEIHATDLLFIDTVHTYEQLSAELKQSKYVNKYIVLHDTNSYWEEGWNDGRGIKDAVEEFLAANPAWTIVYQVEFNHGLMILEK